MTRLDLVSGWIRAPKGATQMFRNWIMYLRSRCEFTLSGAESIGVCNNIGHHAPAPSGALWV
jgi:hypothetical protein